MCDVSIIIPCYKQAGFLAGAVRSALGQTRQPVQVIVVDDGSPDETAAVAGQFGDRVVLIRQANAGVAAARNAGLRRATGRYVGFLDADDWLLPEMAATHVAAMDRGGADVTCSAWRAVGPAGEFLIENPPPAFDPDPFHALLPVNRNPPVCYLFKRSVLEAVGGFDPDRRLSGHEDWDLILRVAATGARFTTTPAVLAVYRLHPSSASARFAGMYDSALAVLAKARAAHPPCDRCGDRFRVAVDKYRHDYYPLAMRPALGGNPLGRRGRAMWKHFLTRGLGSPALVGVVATHVAVGLAERVGRGSRARFALQVKRLSREAPPAPAGGTARPSPASDAG